MTKPALAPGQVDLWYTPTDRIGIPGWRQLYLALLSDEEREQTERLKLPRVRDEYLVTRALVRDVLSYYADVPPTAWSFRQNTYGKPIVSAPWKSFAAFNLSNSAGLVVLAIAAEGQVGVDVENLHRRKAGIDLARRFFSPAEVSLLEACPSDRQFEKFIQIWTLKEAFIKAIGRGLSFPLDRFSMSLPADGPPQIEFRSLGDLPPENASLDWRFAQIRFPTDHHLSLAITLPRSHELVVTAREVIPLADSPRRSESQVAETDHLDQCQRANHWYADLA